MYKRSIVRTLSVLLALVAILTSANAADYRPKKKKLKIKPPETVDCSQYTKIDDCPDIGCTDDLREQDLNLRKNIKTADLSSATNKQFDPLRKKKKPASYVYGGSRQPLTDAGEGDVVTIVAWMTDIRPGSKESCNCRLSKAEDTDNHIVLINDYVINHYTASQWEKHSFTVEFTPRVKQNGHPNFKRSLIRPLMLNDPRGRLKVRITGTLMFDGYHEVHPLAKGRETNWEIHPVFRFEYCPYPNTCTLNSDNGWVYIDD